jgi:uncharacterized metal-binding protein
VPSGRTHDAVTFFLAVPVWLAVWRLTDGYGTATLTALTFLIGGLMFGPDLDTRSVQYGRWGVFKIIWFPYKVFFKHRSVLTHGLLLGTPLRIAYFLGITTVLAIGATIIISFLQTGGFPENVSFMGVWREFGAYSRQLFGPFVFVAVFAGLWLGAASHSLADWVLSYIKTGKA